MPSVNILKKKYKCFIKNWNNINLIVQRRQQQRLLQLDKSFPLIIMFHVKEKKSSVQIVNEEDCK